MKHPPALSFALSASPFFSIGSTKLFAALMSMLIFLCAPFPGKAGALFPVFPGITANVRFWEDVYSRYTTSQGILHDKDNLAIVYTVVDLIPWETAGSASVNQKRITLARQHYKQILTELADGKKPASNDERRVAAMFPQNSHQAFRKARDNIRLQTGQRDRFLDGIIRSGAYIPAMKKIFDSYNLPQELAYLPHVESSFNPDAHSKAGAAGLWQFTRSTGRQYMRVDDIVDQRYDPYYATRAAAVFLQENFAALKSWPLALTAYNHGRNGMLRAVAKHGSYEQIFKNHETELFKFASRNFYSEFIAALNVARRLEKDPNIVPDRPEATIMVRMEGFVRVEDLRSHFQLSEEDFTRLNPSLLKPVLTGKKLIPKNFHVRIPANAGTRDLASTIPARIYYSSQIQDEQYIVRRGDTAGSIARNYKISVAELIAANNLNRKATIRIGQKLKIPGKADLRKNPQVVTLEPNSKIKPN